MPKRLLRYALSRLELLDADALDMENLDLAIGRNTVFEFRDVGIKLEVCLWINRGCDHPGMLTVTQKLEKLLKLPETFALQKAKVLLLRVTIPMDFYTSPITIEVDGVDVRLKVVDSAPKPNKSTKPHATSAVVPNTADLAQSFLDTQPSAERKKLEEALAAETHDLGASVTVSDDGSEDEPIIGTGQSLSLPSFLADFLQGVVDRIQIKIKSVTFQLDLDIPVDMGSSSTEPVSFQIALEGVDIEGVTTQANVSDGGSAKFKPKEGKRQISLENVRAFLVSEANVFSTMTRSPSVASPSVTSSPFMTRNPPSRQISSLSQKLSNEEPMEFSQGSLQNESISSSIESFAATAMASSQADFREHFSIHEDMDEPNDPLTDSEEALGIPYELAHDDIEDESPATPRASVYQDFHYSPEDRQFHSPNSPGSPALYQSDPENELAHSETLEPEPGFESTHSISASQESMPAETTELNMATVPSMNESKEIELPIQASRQTLIEDLAQSHLYTHEEATSMYMSAFSSSDGDAPKDSSEDLDVSLHHQPILAESQQQVPEEPQQARGAMPGSWGEDDDESEDSAASENHSSTVKASEEQHTHASDMASSKASSPDSSPAFSRASLLVDQTSDLDQDNEYEAQQDDGATPKGPTRVVKEVLHLQTISVYIPSQAQHVQPQINPSETITDSARRLSNSIYPQAPGAFSVHGSAPESISHASIQPSKPKDGALEVDLSPLTIRFDASLAFLLAMIVNKLFEAVKDDNPVTAPLSDDAGEVDNTPEIKVSIQEISLNFLNRLGGVADTPRRYLDPTVFMFEHEVLLNATLSNLKMSVTTTEVATGGLNRGKPAKQPATVTKIDLQKFRFGYANGDIVSFDNVRPMSTSVRDTFLSTGYDIGIKMTQIKGNTKTEIETLPLAIQIDLQRLDETFSWFGGLSSFLNMSASMASSPSQTPKSVTLPPPKPRGVRFDAPINPDDKSVASENKINLRVGGAFVELLGKDCSVVAESNAIKLVSRDEGIGIACSMMRVSGPHLRNSMADPAINTEIGGMRLDFLTAPKNADLEKLLELITPSKAKFDHGSDEIMIDTLLRQRRKGSVLRANIETVNIRVRNTAQLAVLPSLVEEMAKLSTVAKYLPEDDRPGLLTLARVQKVAASVDSDSSLGYLSAEVKELEVGHISVPSLVAIAIHGLSLCRNKTEELISSSDFSSSAEIAAKGPVLMARMIGDEIEPVIKLKLQDLCVEYRVPTIMDILGLGSEATPQDFEESLAASVASLGDQAHLALSRQSQSSEEVSRPSKPMTLDIGFRDCLIGLNPLNLPSKLVIAFTDANLEVILPHDEVTKASLNINKASVLLTNDAAGIAEESSSTNSRRRSSTSVSPQVVEMCGRGFVDICYISSAMAVVNVTPGLDGNKQVEVDLRDDLLVLETCADSTQTLITLANALSPPTPPSKENKYRTNVVPVQDLLASISAEAFGKPEGEYDFDQDFAGAQEMAGSGSDIGYGSDNSLRIESQFYGNESGGEELFDATKISGTSQDTFMQDTNEGVLLTGINPSSSHVSDDGEGLMIHDDFYNKGSVKEHAAKVWNSSQNTYDRAPDNLVRRSPLKVSVKDVHLIWNLFDGYDWAHTRDVISKAVHDVEAKAYERQSRLNGPQVYEEEIEDEETIGDFLFNSIYIGIAANRDPQELSRAINEGLNDNATETESVAATAITSTTNRTIRRGHPKSRRLKLRRSKHHKITFELQGINVDMVAFPPDTGETLSSIDVRVQNLDVFDHVPTSTWKKFATYDQDKGEREMGTSMAHLELLNVKPLPSLGASEIVLRVTVLPLRLHVDQDALDFITRFFEFKDDNVPVHSSPSDIPFLQRAEINDISVKLDFKPKRVDYAGLRSGHTTEFMNFIVMEEARMVMRHVIIYGVSGFDRLGKTLNDIWMPDVRTNQLPGVLAGLAPVRSIVNIGSGFKDLVEIPLREYKKDGRVIRSISKGAAAFARTTGTELVKLGAKLAVGTQYALQGAEGMLSDQQQAEGGWEDDDLDPDDKKQISLYADQPTGVIQGIRGGYRSLARDVNMARDAIIAVPGEVMESGSAGGVAKAVWRRAPTIIFRPAVGVTKAIGQTLMGATNSIDPHNQRRIGEVGDQSHYACLASISLTCDTEIQKVLTSNYLEDITCFSGVRLLILQMHISQLSMQTVI